MLKTSAEQNAVNGNGNIADYDVLTGGQLSAAQDPWTAGDEGTLNNSRTGTGKASNKNVNAPGAGNSTAYTPPSWLSSLFGKRATGTARMQTAASSQAPIVGGQPAAGPAQAGAPARRKK